MHSTKLAQSELDGYFESVVMHCVLLAFSTMATLFAESLVSLSVMPIGEKLSRAKVILSAYDAEARLLLP